MLLRSLLLCLALCTCGFFLTALFLHAIVGDPFLLHADGRSEKLSLMNSWRGRATAAAFGSSHVHNGFDPRSFDAALRGTSLAETTLNLAVQGGSQTEQRALALRFVLGLPAASGNERPALVLLELNAGANLTNDHLVHPRSINLYDWPAVKFVWKLTSPRQSVSQRYGRRIYALAAWGLHLTNFGMISSRIFPAPLNPEEVAAETDHDRRGLLSPEVPPGRREAMQALIATDGQAQQSTDAGVLVPGNRSLAEELQRASAAPGLHVAYVVTPSLSNLHHHTQWPACIATSGGPVPILTLDSPDRYPELFATGANWTDDSHLTEQGASMAGEILADQWKGWTQMTSTSVPACAS